jgi:hypothetical protein
MQSRALAGLLCLFLMITTVISCDIDKAVAPSGSCTFRINDTAYSANSAYAYVDTTVKDKKLLTIEAVTGTLNRHLAINIYMKDFLHAGEFTEADSASVLFSESLSSQGVSYLSESISIKITSINSKYAEGTFAGILKNGETVKPLTDGIFKVNISTEY